LTLKYRFWARSFPRMGRRTPWFNMMGLTWTIGKAKLECNLWGCIIGLGWQKQAGAWVIYV
jgi:hypothetical protein